MEDAQVFNFSLGLTPRSDELFYSRRIGRAPQGYAPWDADFDETPPDATILGAAKVTGRTDSGLSLGALGRYDPGRAWAGVLRGGCPLRGLSGGAPGPTSAW